MPPGQTQDVQAEMERLGRNYAQLLGHQNQKQKIRHIVKIKEENCALRKVCRVCSHYRDMKLAEKNRQSFGLKDTYLYIFMLIYIN